MGLSAASLHLLRPTSEADLTSAVAAAYKKLGYSKAKDDGPDARGVALADRGDFVSIHDSRNDTVDTGELRHLAVILSKSTKSVAIVTTVNDSDTFEFLLFHRGKQIDAALNQSPSDDAGLTILEGRKRARAWFDAFQQRDFLAVARGNSIGFRPETQIARYADAVAAAAGTESPFAEAILGAWCTAAGLSSDAPCLTYRDCVENPSLATTRLVFAPGPARSSRAKSDAPSPAAGPVGAVQLAFTHDDDDGAHLVFHPAAWPVPANRASTLQWFLVSTGAGFRGLCVGLTIEAVGDLRVQSARIVAYPFYNGQVTSMTPAAQHEFPTPRVEDDGESRRSVALRLDAPDFELPTPRPESKRQTLIILSVNVETGSSGHAELAPFVEPSGVEASAPRLPALRLVWREPAWIPLVSGVSPEGQTLAAIRRLSSPSCRAQLAVLRGDDAATRAAFRRLFESCLGAMQPSASIRARVRTRKHMSASFSVSKNERWTELSALLSDKAWDRLFDGDADYQSVFVDLFPNLFPDAALYPQAGLVMQASLRGSALAGPGRPFLTGGVWVLDHPDVYATFGLGGADVEARFATWIPTTTAVHAWSQSAAWIPMFDTYDAYRQTPYESAVTPGWFRAGLDGAASLGAWHGSRLRTIAPDMWLDESMLADVDLAALDRIVERQRVGALSHIRLRAGATLNDLERVFASGLPIVI